MSTKAIHQTLTVLVFATLIVPFIIFNSSYFPYIVGKAFIFRILVSIALVFWGWLVFRDSKYLPSKNGVLVSFGLLTLFYLISAVFGEDFRNSVFSNFERMGGWIASAFLFVFFLITSSVLKGKEIWNKFFFAQIATSLVLFLLGIKELFASGIGTRIDASLGNPIYLAVIFLFSIFFALYLMFENYSKSVKYFLGATIFINALGIFFTGTRGAMLGLFVAGLFLAIYLTIKFWSFKKVKITGLTFLIIAILAPITLFSFKDSSFVQRNGTLTRITQISIQEGTGYARFVNWGSAINGAKERPVFGWGQENYTYVFDKYYDPRMYSQEPFFDSSHNTPLDVLVHGGILALFAYLSLIVFAIINVFKNSEIKSEQKFIIASLFGAYFINNLFVFDNLTSSVLMAMVLAFSVYYKNSNAKSDFVRTLALSMAIVISITALIFTVLIPWRANSNLIKGVRFVYNTEGGEMRFIHPNGIIDNQKFLKKALNNNQVGIFEILSSASKLSASASQIKTEEEKVKKDIENIVNFSIGEYKKEIVERPTDARTMYSFAIFLAQIGDFSGAEKVINEAILISPNRQIYLNLLGSLKRAQGKDAEFLDISKKVYELEKTNDNAWLTYITAVGSGDSESFQKLLLEAKDSGDIDRVIRVLNVAISNSPDKPQAYVNKVVILSKMGLFEDAIETLNSIDEKFPELSAQTKAWRSLFEKGQLPK